jgi:hypothetical protein
VVGLRSKDVQGQLVVFMVFVGAAQDGNRLYRLGDIARFLEALVVLLPDCQLLVLDEAFELLDSDCVFLEGSGLDLVVDEVQSFHLILELFQPVDDRPNKNGAS